MPKPKSQKQQLIEMLLEVRDAYASLLCSDYATFSNPNPDLDDETIQKCNMLLAQIRDDA